MAYPDAAGADGRRLVPEVAAEPPAVSADGRTYTFRIRAGYRFSPPSGAPVTAETFRSSIERALSPRLGEEAPALSVLGDVAGAADYHAGRARHVRGLAAEGDRLTIRLAQPGRRPAGAPRAAAVLPRAGGHARRPRAAARSRCRRPARTTSPPRTSRPHRAPAQPELPRRRPRRPDRIVYLTGIGADEALERADKGEVDYVPYDYDQHGPLAVGGPRDRQFGATSAAARRGDQRYFASPAPGLDMLAFNTAPAAVPRRRDAARGEPGARPARARRGLGRAADRPPHPARDPAGERRPPRYPVAAPDVRAARRLAAGRRGTATLYYCGEAANRRVAEIVRANLRPIGIRVRITPSLACLRGPDPAPRPRRHRARLAGVAGARRGALPRVRRRRRREFGGQVLPRAGPSTIRAFTATARARGPARGARPGGVVRRPGGGARRGRPARGVQQLRPAGVRLAAGRMPRDPGRPPVPRPRGGVRATGLARATR